MKKFLILFLSISVMLFISCGDDDTSDTKTCDPACQAWETCNDGTCESTEGKCASNDNCKDSEKPVCDMDTHECVADNTPECTSNEDCTDSAKPVCQDGVCVADNTPECTSNEDCTDSAKPVCQEGVCVAENDTPECTSNEDCTDSAKPVCQEGVCVAESNSGDCIGLSFENIPKDEAYNAWYHQQVGDYEINIEFYAENTPVGTYDLGSETNDNYAYCEQCVRIARLNGENVEKHFFQESGTLEVTAGDASTAESAGQVTTVKLVEVTIDMEGDNPTYNTTPVANGECIEIQAGTSPWNWDSMPHCTEGDTRCNGDIVETCDANDTWVESANCDDNGSICNQPDGGAATCVICVADTKQCNADGNIETCKADQSGWEVTTTCTSPEVCEQASDGSFSCEVPFICADHDLDGVGNDAQNASELTLPVSGKTGYVCKEVDDWYKFDLVKGDIIDVALTFTHEDGDIDLALFLDPAADPISGAGSTDDNETFSYTATEAGTYYLQVVSKYLDKGNSYTLDIAKTDACIQNTDCSEGNNNVCSPESHTCVECVSDSDCLNGETCNSNICFAQTANGCIGVSFENIQAVSSIFGGVSYRDVVGPYNLVVAFYAETPAGTYDLTSAGVNDNYETCNQCVTAYTVNDAGDAIEKNFFQSTGTLEVTAGEGTSGESAGKITNIKLIEVTIDDAGDNPTYHSTPVENGECIELETGTTDWSWDSMPAGR